MSKPNLILIGAGGHARACMDVIEQEGKYHIAGLVGRQEEMQTQHLGYGVIATDDDLQELINRYPYALITVGTVGSPDKRIHLYQQAIQLGFDVPCIVAPTAHVSKHATIGAGTIVMHGAIINAGATVGKNCIINSRALVEHDATVNDHCHVSTGAILNGSVTIGEGSFVGSGSVIRDGLTLGQRCLVGMGLSVRHNQPDHTRFVGTNKP